MSFSLTKSRTQGSLTKKNKDAKDYDESPTYTVQNSPRFSYNASFYDKNNNVANSTSGNVKVVCRVRPFNQKEMELGGSVCVKVDDEKTISIKTSQYMDCASSALSFTFDRVFDMEAGQEEVYEFAAKPVVESVLEGFNGTVFAYGQTSSGKTYTMMGPDLDNNEFCGVIPRMVATVFDYISETPDHIEFTVKVSIIEIYMERIRDLLNPKKVNLKIREDKTRGIYIEDVTESYVSDENDVYDFMRYGHCNRATSTTNMNESSSRSHCIYMLTIHQNNLIEMSAKTGKLYLVDLAGSEKVAKTGAIGHVLEEAKEINKSLSALGNVINALTDNKGHQHIPYRDSKLTRILQESLGGNSRTSLIINCSPSSFNENETLSALRFGYRAKSIKNTPKINREFTAAQLQILLEKAERKLVIKDRKVKLLENVLMEHGIAFPFENDGLVSESPSPINKKQNHNRWNNFGDEDETFDDDSISKIDLMSPQRPSMNYNQNERIRALENELKMERLSLSKQSEKVNFLKKDLAENNNKMLMIEKENEALINKLATLTLKMQELEEKFRDKEMKLEILQLLKDILMTENEELKKSRKVFLNDLDEENNEIIKLAQKEGLIPIKKDSPQEVNNKENFIFLDDLIKDMTKDMAQKLNIKNVQTLKELTSPYVDKLKETFQAHNELVMRRAKSSGDEGDLKKKYEKLKEELAMEKQKNSHIKTEYEKVIKEYDNLVKNNIPSFEEWKQGIIYDNPAEESLDIKDDTVLLKEFVKGNIRETKVGLQLDPAKDKHMENPLKIDYLNPSQNLLTPALLEKKSPLKTQRMINLEKQLHETKELVNQYKNKIESLKSLITTNPNSTQTTFKMEDSETFKHHKEIIKQEVLDQVISKKGESLTSSELSPKSSANLKLVKPIKGGGQVKNTIQKSSSGVFDKDKDKKSAAGNHKFFDVLKQQYRYNRTVMGSIGEGILSKNKAQSGVTGKNQSEVKSKGV